MPKADPVHKVTIIPRGRALGVTFFLPERDRYGYSKEQMLSFMAVSFGGRIAEEVFLNQQTTGAKQDFEHATSLARDMVMHYGMTDSLGPMVYGENEGEVFLGRSVTTHKNVSESTLQKVDEEIRRLIDLQYGAARKIIEENRDKVESIARALLEMETLDSEQVNDIMSGNPPRPPKSSSSSGGGDSPKPASDGPAAAAGATTATA